MRLRDTVGPWIAASVLAVTGVVIGVSSGVNGGWVGIGVGAALVVIAVLNSPLRPGRHMSLGEARQASGPDEVIVFWKPGCTVCIIERARLSASQRRAVAWVNVWKDRDAAELVASLNDGDLLTPTAITGDGRRLAGAGVRHATAHAIGEQLHSP